MGHTRDTRGPYGSSAVSLQVGVFVVLVARQDEAAVNSIRQQEWLQEGCRKPDGFSTGTQRDHLRRHAAVIIQIFRRRNVEIELLSMHGVAPDPSQKGSCRTGLSIAEIGRP